MLVKAALVSYSPLGPKLQCSLNVKVANFSIQKDAYINYAEIKLVGFIMSIAFYYQLLILTVQYRFKICHLN